jgi:CRISPR-associated protein Cas2
MILEKIPKTLRGELSRWLIEVKTGVFIGNPSQRVREELWKKVTARPPLGYVLQLWSVSNPRGFDFRQYGDADHALTDFDGLALLTRKTK